MLLSLSQWLMQAFPEQLGFLRIFQYLTWADCQANGDVMPAMVMLIHEDDFRQEKANDILPLDICTIEGIGSQKHSVVAESTN